MYIAEDEYIQACKKDKHKRLDKAYLIGLVCAVLACIFWAVVFGLMSGCTYGQIAYMQDYSRQEQAQYHRQRVLQGRLIDAQNNQFRGGCSGGGMYETMAEMGYYPK